MKQTPLWGGDCQRARGRAVAEHAAWPRGIWSYCLLQKQKGEGGFKMLFGILQQNRAKQTLLKALVAELGGDVGAERVYI